MSATIANRPRNHNSTALWTPKTKPAGKDSRPALHHGHALWARTWAMLSLQTASAFWSITCRAFGTSSKWSQNPSIGGVPPLLNLRQLPKLLQKSWQTEGRWGNTSSRSVEVTVASNRWSVWALTEPWWTLSVTLHSPLPKCTNRTLALWYVATRLSRTASLNGTPPLDNLQRPTKCPAVHIAKT